MLVLASQDRYADTDQYKGAEEGGAAVEKRPELARFTSTIFSQIDALSGSRSSVIETAAVLRQLVIELIARETGKSTLTAGMGDLVHTLCAADYHLTSLSRLHYKLQQARAGDLPNTRVVRSDLLYHTKEVLAWYAKRRALIDLLEYESGGNDYILPLSINENASVYGAPGIEVLSAVRLNFHNHQQLSASLFLREEGRAVMANSSWGENVGAFPNDEAKVSPVCAFVPLSPQRSHSVLDEVRLGVPYAALRLNPGWHNLELILKISDESGAVLAEREEGRMVFVEAVVGCDEPRSPQSRALWEHDPITGSAIKDLSIGQNSQGMIAVACGLKLSSDTAAALKISCDLLSEEGYSILPENLSPQKRCHLYEPVDACAVICQLSWDFPRAALELDPGECGILVDISVKGERARPVIGALRRFRL